MGISVGSLKLICDTNTVELKFNRRNKLRIPPTRRMLCTLDFSILDTEQGKKLLGFKKPKQRPPYNAASKGLLTVWDIIMQDWRNIPVDSCIIVATLSNRPITRFWNYYNRILSKMPASTKKEFMEK